MLNNILEISKRVSKGGRVPIKIALLKIHDDPNETNKNGLHWKREYVQNEINSTKMMPICAEFTSVDKDVPLGHGLTGSMINQDGLEEPEFLNSEIVGVIESASIEEFKNDDDSYELLVGSGYLYNQRYPNFVSWIRKKYVTNEVDTSIEIIGLPENDNKIIYEEATPTDEYRTPKEFLFSGTAILSISPADDNAVVLEVAQRQIRKKEEQNMEFDMNELTAVIQSTISETNSKSDELNEKIAELNSVIAEKDSVIAEKEEKIVELNSKVEQIQKVLDDLKKEHETYWAERELLEQELVKAKVAEKLNELDSAVGEFNEEEKQVAKDDIENLRNAINSCKTRDELNNVSTEINSIKSKICVNIVEKQKAEEAAHISEVNSNKPQANEVFDIFSEMCSVTDDNNKIDEFDIF